MVYEKKTLTGDTVEATDDLLSNWLSILRERHTIVVPFTSCSELAVQVAGDLHREMLELISQRSDPPDALGDLMWQKKWYPTVKLVRSSIATVATVFALLCWAAALLLKTCSNCHDLAHGARVSSPSSMWPILIGFVLVIALAGIATVHRAGAMVISGTLYALTKDFADYPFVGRLGGTGTSCPLCRGSLRLHNVAGIGAMLICKRTNSHRWRFDPTSVTD